MTVLLIKLRLHSFEFSVWCHTAAGYNVGRTVPAGRLLSVR